MATHSRLMGIMLLAAFWYGCARDHPSASPPRFDKGAEINGGDARVQVWFETQDGATATTRARVGVYRPGLLSLEEQEGIEGSFSLVTWPEGREILASVTMVERAERNGEWRIYEIAPKGPPAARWYALRIREQAAWMRVTRSPSMRHALDGYATIVFRPDSAPLPLRARVCKKASSSDKFVILTVFSEALQLEEGLEPITVVDAIDRLSIPCASTIMNSMIHTTCLGTSSMEATHVSLNPSLVGTGGWPLTRTGVLEYDLPISGGFYDGECWLFEL